MSQSSWEPSCSLSAIKARSEMYSQIRAFFYAREVLEVDTPVLGASTATDPLLASMQLNADMGAGSKTYYLQTSPEFPMKRLVAAHHASIFQICKTFREAERGSRHNPEFTMLEWYRPDMSLTDLMQETVDLVQEVCGEMTVEKKSYRELFIHYAGLDPFASDIDALMHCASTQAHYEGEKLSRTELLDLIMSICIEPRLAERVGKMLFVFDYPKEQASLAKTRVDEFGNTVAERFELYINGLEIANAYHELTDACEQRSRFEEDNRQRVMLGLPEIPLDENLLNALDSGLPECSGIALGLDRLLMVKTGVNDIGEVMAFPANRV